MTMDVLGDVIMFIAPIWVAVLVGVFVGWAWKPKVANLVREFVVSSLSAVAAVASDDSISSSEVDLPVPVPVSVSAENNADSRSSLKDFGLVSGLNALKSQLPSCVYWNSNDGGVVKDDAALTECSSQNGKESSSSGLVNGDDLEHLCQLVEEKDGGPSWIQMMDRSTPTMHYKAWRRDPVTGPPQYRSSTIYEDTTPEIMRDFFWDDEFRSQWDDMLLHASTLEECPTTGTMLVHWVRKFPLFCSDREYAIGRRIWESGRSYYCVTKGVPCSSMPRHKKPRRVDLYYSSWYIRAVESKRGNGEFTACEVVLFHHEDMGIPWELAKLGVRQGMWAAVQKIEPGLRAYQKHRGLGPASLSRSAFMAQINTKVNADYLRSLEASKNDTIEKTKDSDDPSEKKAAGQNFPKLLVVGGAIVLACSLDRGLLTKAVIFGVARKFAKIGRRM